MWQELGEKLATQAEDSRCVFIVAPYIKAQTLKRILQRVKLMNQLVCITRWSVDELIQGVSDISVRKITQEAGGKFMLHQRLHANYYRFDAQIFVGSANVTDRAMGWSSLSNLEILYRVNDEFDHNGFEKEVLCGSREIGDLEEKGWKLAVGRAQQSFEQSHEGQRVRHEWSPKARDIRSVLHMYSGHRDAIASVDEQDSAMGDLEVLEIPDGLGSEDVLVWISSRLVSSSFVNAVIAKQSITSDRAARELAYEYHRDIVEARRGLEAVGNWLSFLAER